MIHIVVSKYMRGNLQPEYNYFINVHLITPSRDILLTGVAIMGVYYTGKYIFNKLSG